MDSVRPVRKPIAFLLAALLVGAPAGCGGDDEAAEAAPPAGDLTVMSFNVWYGGASVDFGQIAAAIGAADADIVGVQEPEANLRRIADAAGLQYVDESLHLISRYPLFPAERDGVRFAYAEVARGRVVAVTNAHLTCCPYGPNLVRNGKSAEQVMAVERRLRVPEAKPYARALAGLAADDIPAFITGDFNSPSHLDWTAEAVAARDLPFELEWPASKAFADAGLRDSYREIHPDPAAEPGLSWTAGTPPPRIRERETVDRIDWILAAGPSTTVDSRLVGEVGGPDVEVGVSPWGSDHRAVASTFEVEAARAPDLVSASPRVVPRGERLTIRYALGGSGGGREVGVLPADARGRRRGDRDDPDLRRRRPHRPDALDRDPRAGPLCGRPDRRRRRDPRLDPVLGREPRRPVRRSPRTRRRTRRASRSTSAGATRPATSSTRSASTRPASRASTSTSASSTSAPAPPAPSS